PLLASQQFGLTLQQTLGANRDGLEPETVYRWAGVLQRFSSPFLGLVSLPKWMAGNGNAKPSVYHAKRAGSAEQAQFVLRSLLKNCKKQLDSLKPADQTDSTWSGYLDHKSLYSAEQLSEKETFVREALDLACPATVLDIGANEGRFSFLSAKSGASVVAID